MRHKALMRYLQTTKALQYSRVNILDLESSKYFIQRGFDLKKINLFLSQVMTKKKRKEKDFSNLWAINFIFESQVKTFFPFSFEFEKIVKQLAF